MDYKSYNYKIRVLRQNPVRAVSDTIMSDFVEYAVDKYGKEKILYSRFTSVSSYISFEKNDGMHVYHITHDSNGEMFITDIDTRYKKKVSGVPAEDRYALYDQMLEEEGDE